MPPKKKKPPTKKPKNGSRAPGAKIKKEVKRRAQGQDAYTNKKLRKNAEFDHRIAYSRGGLTTASNLAIVNRETNRKKGTQTTKQFLQNLKKEGKRRRCQHGATDNKQCKLYALKKSNYCSRHKN